MSKKIEKFEDLIAWQKARKLMNQAVEVGKIIGGLRASVDRRRLKPT
jgi:hypothetical protein